MADHEHDGSLGDWLARFGVSWPVRRGDPLWSPVRKARTPGVRTSRALPRFLDALRIREAPVLLDLGLVSGANVEFLGRELSCRLLVQDLYTRITDADRSLPDGLATAVRQGIAADPGSVDGVLCWDLCDYLTGDEARVLTGEVGRVLKPGGYALALFSTVRYESPEFTRFVALGSDQLEYRPCPGGLLQQGVWSSRDIARLWAPLKVDETYLLAHGQREVLLRRPAAS